jgi:hypothetical protein
MPFQKCPLCEGRGSEHEALFLDACQVCLGKLIIHTETGLPPAERVEAQVTEASDKAEEIVTPLSAFEELSEEEIMYWSTPTYDEIQERKDLAERQRKENETTGRVEISAAIT